MKIIQRYVLKEYLKLFALCLSATVGLYLIVDILEKLDTLLHYNAPVGLAVSYFLFKIPMIIYQMIPVTVLLSTLLTLGMMARHNEITVLRASGISLARIVAPLIIVSLILPLVLVVGDEFVISPFAFKAEQIKEVSIKKKERRGFFNKDQLWYHNGRNIYYVKKFDAKLDILKELTILTFDDQFVLTRRLDAAWAQWYNGDWHFYQVNLKTFTDGKISQQQNYARKIIKFPETPQTFKIVEKKAEEMSFSELRELANNLQAQGYDATKYRVDMQAKLSFPFAALIMVFVGIPFALKTGRSKGIALGIGISLCIAFLYWATFSLSVALGHSGVLPPLLAAWFTNILFILAGIFMFINIKH